VMFMLALFSGEFVYSNVAGSASDLQATVAFAVFLFLAYVRCVFYYFLMLSYSGLIRFIFILLEKCDHY
jgi:hypothetical protein